MKAVSRLLLAVLTGGLLTGKLFAEVTYPIVSTGQAKCYDDSAEIPPPEPGEPFHGQDAQFRIHPASYSLGADGLTVRDNVTALTWQRGPDTDRDGEITAGDKLTFAQAEELPAKLNAARFGGFTDWRLPTIKELYSLFDARGIDPSPAATDASGLIPFIDNRYFQFAYGDTNARERIIDAQYASGTVYVGSTRRETLIFGVNFADGRIKGYGSKRMGRDKTFFVQCVRGNAAYGKNEFRDNGDGTVTDRATGLMWSQTDSVTGMNWEAALGWVQKKNAQKYLGHADWRLPSVKELQSLVDYTRSPETTQSAAIDPLFETTAIKNAIGQTDYPYYWSGTTHVHENRGDAAMYIAFGRAAGWMPRHGPGGPPPHIGGPPPGDNPPSAGTMAGKEYVNVHGAGAQRSDPKCGDPGEYPQGRGPQGDVIGIYNFVRLVRRL
jgi:hypothetical protein